MRKVVITIAAIALCSVFIYWLCLLHWSIAVAVTCIVLLGALSEKDYE